MKSPKGANRPAFAAAIAAGLLIAGCAQGASSTRANIESGSLIGQTENGVTTFKGIPYAAAPVGDLRWKPPKPAARWVAPRKADTFGPICPQALNPNGVPNAGGAVGPTSEDCLTLNVWAPAGAAKAPVMVWLHGGGNTTGAGSLGAYDGTAFARDGVVLVTLNYRLGALGFFAHPALTAAARPDEPLINYGIMDQIAALRWVKKNIASFGGDPDSVTVFGESAGGQDILTLMTTPSTDGLFSRAIVESGGGWGPPVSLAKREVQGADLAMKAGAPAGASPAQLRALPADAFSALPAFASGPGIDGRLLKQSIAQAFSEGHFSHVPLIIGSNSFEASLLNSLKVPPAAALAMAPAMLKSVYADAPDDLTKARALFTDSVMGAPARWIAGQAVDSPSWLYHFSYVVDAQRSRVPGAGHASEIPFVFASWDHLGALSQGIKPTAADLEVTAQIHACWVSFAKSGVPDCPGAPGWPRYSFLHDTLMKFDRSAETVTHFRAPYYTAQEAVVLPTLELPTPGAKATPPALPIRPD